MVDELPANDETSRRAISGVYGLDELGQAAFEQLAEAWRPYRMWAVVLLRFSANRETTVQEHRGTED
jgi:3-methyladenine DNA glycosylase/8-oxoguanine DNA glycosylase